ncbi:hypothetical protein IRJ41_019354, partial [Triplophysa rosa]
MAAFVGRMDAFDSTVEDWVTYLERVGQYCLANDIEDSRKVAVLLSIMGAKTYNLLRSLKVQTAPLTAPIKPAEKTFKEIVDVLQMHLNPKPLVIAERFRFHKRNQQKAETVFEYMAELRMLAEHCQFGEGLSDALRDRLVCGLHSESTQKRLLTERELTLVRALEIAVSMETAARDALELQRKSPAECQVNKLATKRSEKSSACYRCGKKSHESADCWFKEKECRQCRKKGHIQKMCTIRPSEKKRKSFAKKGSRKVIELNESDSESSDAAGLSCLELHSLKETDRKIIWVSPVIEGVNYVLKKGGVPLFGREWLRSIRLNWQSIKTMELNSERASCSVQDKLERVLAQYPQVFEEGIGMLKHIKAKLTIKSDVQPKFHKARPVPYSVCPKVEAQLKRLGDQGILLKVDWSDWATPIVPIVKKSGDVRICGDFKVTINPVLQVDQYPLPRIEDIFASLSGGQRFSKIDLAQAYLQMEMEHSSKKYLTINTHRGLFRYNRLVFGVSLAPAVWQRAMDQVLQGVPAAQCYLDDIIVTANKSKCEFLKDSIEYCGHQIDKDGLHKSADKVNAVLNETQLCSFLGLVNYYHKLLPNISTVLHPLNALLQQESNWIWSKCV